MLVNNVCLAWQFYRQEYHFSHQRLLRWTQTILLVFMLALSQSSLSIQQYLEQNLQGLLGADALISQHQRLDSEQLESLALQVDELVTTQQLKINFSHQKNWQHISLKAVSSNYPLQGELLAANSLDGSTIVSLAGPKPGEVWFDSRLLSRFNLKTGDVVSISEQHFTLAKILIHEPDRLLEGHNVDMRAMINIADMQKLNINEDLIQFRYLLGLKSEKLAPLQAWQKQHLPAANFIHKKGNHPLALFWQRTENVLGLTSIILFFMAAVAIEQISIKHKSKEQYFSAVCMSLGATNRTGVIVSVIKWCFSFVLQLPFALLIGTLSHWFIIRHLTEFFPELEWQWHLAEMFETLGFVSALFAFFYLPVWFSLGTNTVSKLIINLSSDANHWGQKLVTILVLTIVVFTYSDNGLLTTMMLSALGVTILLILLLSWLALTLGEKLTQNSSGLLPFTFFMMKQRLVSKSTQILGVGLSAFLLLFTLMLLHDLGKTMSLYQRTHDGNLMISQATTEQMQYIRTWAVKNNISIRQDKAYMHAKLIEINKQSPTDFSSKPSDSLARFSRKIRMHWNNTVPSNNRVVSGAWWQAKVKNWHQISIEEEVMTDMGLSLGDELSFIISGSRYDFSIVASHAYKSGNGSITFWLQIPHEAAKHISANHYNMASLEVAEPQQVLLGGLWQKYPTLRMVSLQEMTTRFDKTLAMITAVISGFSIVVMLLTGIVILASINASETKERKKNSIIMSFGFSRATCLKLNVIEWLITAFIAASGAIIGTYIAGLLIYQSQFSLNYQPDFVWLFTTLLAILCGVTSLGVIANRHSLQSSIRQLMVE